MRKFASLFLLLFLIFSLAACSQSENSDTDSEQPPTIGGNKYAII